MKVKKPLEKVLVVVICMLFIFSVFATSISMGENGEDNEKMKNSTNIENEDNIDDKGSGSVYEPLEGKPSYDSSQNKLTGEEDMSQEALSAFNTKKYHKLEEAWRNYDGTGTNIGLVDSGVDFANPELQGKYAVVEDTDSPYYGWPIAFDPLSMNKLLKSNDVSNTWYVDTSREGEGPFNYSHKIKVDGSDDFAPTDEVATSPKESGKDYWDLKDLFASRDKDNWYFGFSTNVPTAKYAANVTNALFIDSDQGASGGLYSPKGKSADFNTSHKDTLTSVAYNPAGDLVASCGLDMKTKIWDAADGSLEMVLEGQESPLSLDWTDDGNLVTANPTQVIVWDISTGNPIKTINYFQTEDDPLDNPYLSLVDFHKNSTGAQEEWLAIAGGKMVHIYDSNWNHYGSIKAGYNSYSVEFSPSGEYIAVGLGEPSNKLNVYDWSALNTTADPETVWTDPTAPTATAPISFALGNTVTTLSWKSDSTELLAGTADKGVTSIWSIPKTEANYTAQPTEEITSGQIVDETDDVISDLHINASSSSPLGSVNGDGWYTLEANENLSIGGFDIGPTGGKIIEIYLDMRYDVNNNSKMSDDSYWNEEYMQIKKPDGKWETLGIQPKNESLNLTYSEDLSSIYSLVEDIRDIEVRYNFDYDGPAPGFSVSFDYINLRYKYISGKIYQNHSSAITSVGWSNDGNTVLSTESGDPSAIPNIPEIHIWDPSNRETLASKELYQPVYSTNWLDSNNFVSGSRDCSLREWNRDLVETEVFRQNKPNYALFVNLTSRYDDRSGGYIIAGGRPEFYKWSGSEWVNPKFSDIKGTYSTGEDSSFIEFSVPREEISGDPQSIDVQMVSFGREINNIEMGGLEDTSHSHAQDSVPFDKNVFKRVFQYGTINEMNIPWLHLAENTLSEWKGATENEAMDITGDMNIDAVTSSPHLPADDDGWFTATGGNNISLEPSGNLPAFSASIENVELEIKYSVNAQGSETMGSDDLKYLIGSDVYSTGITFSVGDTDNTETVSLDEVGLISDLDNLKIFYNHSGSATLNIDYLKLSYDYSVKATSLSAFETVFIPKYSINLNNKASASNNYHFGMHPSEELTRKIGQPGLLVIDTTTSDVYDTVMIDLNMDYEFTDDDITLTRNNPIDYIDNYNATIPTEPTDEKNLTTPDGFPDISSGLLYYISKATKNVSDPITLADFNKDNETYINGENISTFPNILKVYKEGTLWEDEYIYRTLTFEEKISSLDTDGNIQDGTLRIIGEDLAVDNRTVFEAAGRDKEFFLPHGDLEDLKLYYNGTMDDWIELPILSQAEDVSDWQDAKYDGIFCAVNTDTGLVDFNPAFRLYPNDKIYGTYNWTGELEEGNDYKVDYVGGKISFTESIYNYSQITIEYKFDYWSVSFDEEEDKYKLKLTDVVFGDKLEENEEIILHFSSNALPVPGSEEQSEVLGVDNVLPGNGDLICLMGDFEEEVDIFEEAGQHGTAVGSILVGDGSGYENAQRLNAIVDNMNNATLHPDNPFSVNGSYKKLNIPKVEGIAPGASIIPVGNAYSDLYSSWNFLVKGYDGIVGTDDEANVISNPYSIEDEQLAGWDVYSRKAEVAMLLDGKSEKLFIGSAGMQGPGYGTILPPGGAPHMLTVGYANVENGETEGPNVKGPVVPSYSSKGPTPMGYPKPEVVALGKYNVSFPLHRGYSGEGSNGASINVYPSNPFFGGDISCAVATGIAALAYQASGSGFNQSVGRSILMSASQDTKGNILKQGAGLLDAELATQIASGSSGFRVEEPVWVPGDFNGDDIEGFTKAVKPGDEITKEFTVDYTSGSASTSVSQGTYQKIGSYQYEDETMDYQYQDMVGIKHQMYDRSTGFVVNESGLFRLVTDPEDQMMIKDEVEHYQNNPALGQEFGVQAYPTSEKVFGFNLSTDPDMVRIRAHSDYDEIYSKAGDVENGYFLGAFNWENRMGDYLEMLNNDSAPAVNGAQQFPERKWITPETELSNITSLTMDQGTDDVGLYPAIVTDTAGDSHIAYYNNKTKNLEYIRLINATTVPEFTHETIDSAGDVGKYSSIAFDSSNNPAVSYYDETNGDLKFAHHDGTAWNIETVDSAGDVGKYTSISYIAMQGDVPLISYYDETNGNLKVAMDTGAWTIMTVDNTGDVGQYTSIAVDSPDPDSNPRVSYYDVTNGDLKFASFNGATWDIETIDSVGEVGKYTDLSSIATYGDSPIISYYDETNGDLKIAIDTGAWSVQTVDSAGDVGKHTSVAIDSNNLPAISYYDEINTSLKYAIFDGVSWTIQTVDDTSETGMYTSLEEGALYQFDIPLIVYYDSKYGALKNAINLTYEMNPSWELSTMLRSTHHNKQYIYAGDNGEDGIQSLEIMEIRDVNESAQKIFMKSYVDIGVTPMDMDYFELQRDQFVAIAAGDDGIMIVNVTLKDNPTIEASYDTSGYAYSVYNSHGKIYVADGDSGLKIFDASDITSGPIGSLLTNATALDVTVEDDFAYIAQLDHGVLFANISNPSAPTYIDHFIEKTGEAVNVTDARSCYVDGDYLYVADGENGIKILDITYLTNVKPVSQTSNETTPGTAVDLEMMPKDVNPDRLFVSDGEGGLRIIDVSDRSDPEHEWPKDPEDTHFNAHLVDALAWSDDYDTHLPIIMSSDYFSCIHRYLPKSNVYPSDHTKYNVLPTARIIRNSYNETQDSFNHSINGPLFVSGVNGNLPMCNFPTLTSNDDPSYTVRTLNLSLYEPYINQSNPNFNYLYESTGTEILYELNVIDFDGLSNSMSVQVDDVSTLSQNGGLFVYLEALGKDTENTNWTFEIEFFKNKPHEWINVDSSVSGNTFTATLNVPEDAKPGSYEASIKLETTDQVVTIPVLINVMSENMMTEFGGEEEDKYLYSNSLTTGSAGDKDNSGDWRYYYINVPDQARYKSAGEGINMVTEIDWTRKVNVYSTVGSGDVSTANIHGEPDGQYAELAPGDEINIGGLDVSQFDSTVNNVKIMVKHKYDGMVPEVDSNNLTLTYTKDGSVMDVNVTENATISELDITWDSHEFGAPKWNWALVGGITMDIQHKIRGLPGDGKLLIDSIWLEVDTKNVVELRDNNAIMTSDIDIQVLQPTKDFGASKGEALFGKGVSASVSSIGDRGETNTNTTRTVFGTSVVPGLNVIAVRNTRVDGGYGPGERLSGRVFPLEIKPVPGDINTNEMLSTSTFKFLSGMKVHRFNATAIGPAQSETLSGVPIPQDDFAADWFNSITFVELLATKSTYHKHISVKNALSIEISCWDEDGAIDVDLGLFLDANGNGIPETDEFVKYSGVGGSDEHIKIMNPADGEYILTVLGYTTSDPGYIGMKISVVLAGVEGYELENVPRQPLAPFEEGRFDLKWNFPGDAEDSVYGGVINVGLDGTQDIITIPLNVFLDTRPPEIKDTSPEPNEIISDDEPPILATYTDIIKERTKEKYDVYVGELKLGNASADDWERKERDVVKEIEGTGVDTSNIWIRLDDENITTYSSIREDGTMSYVPTESMEDGIHYVSIKAKDRAGNVRVHNWSFEIDTTLPEISFSGDLTRGLDDIMFTNMDVLPISGSLSKDTETLELSISNDTSTMTKEIDVVDSSFDDEITLDEDGMYELTFKATDRVDNSMEQMIMVYKDTAEPDIKINSPLPNEDVSNKDVLTFKGEIDRKEELGDVKVYVDGVEVKVMADGYFEYTVNMEEGENEFEITAVDEAGNTGSTTRAMEKDTTSPSIEWDYELNGNEITISGSVDEEADVMINGKPIAVSGDSFSSTIALRKNSMNEVIITAEDEAGNLAQSTKSIDLEKEEEEGMSGSMMGAIIAAIVIALLAGLLLGFKVLPMFLGKEEEEEVIEEEEEEVPIEEEMEEKEAITDEEGEELEEELFGEEEEVEAGEEVTEEDIFGEPEEGEELEEDFEEETVEEEVIDEELEEGEIEPEPEEETEEQALEEPGGTEETIDEEAMDEEVEESEDKVDVDLDEEKTDELE